MFMFITIFYIPIMAIYSSNAQQQLSKQSSLGMSYSASGVSLGNLGGATVKCEQNKLMF